MRKFNICLFFILLHITILLANHSLVILKMTGFIALNTSYKYNSARPLYVLIFKNMIYVTIYLHQLHTGTKHNITIITCYSQPIMLSLETKVDFCQCSRKTETWRLLLGFQRKCNIFVKVKSEIFAIVHTCAVSTQQYIWFPPNIWTAILVTRGCLTPLSLLMKPYTHRMLHVSTNRRTAMACFCQIVYMYMCKYAQCGATSVTKRFMVICACIPVSTEETFCHH